MEKIRKRFNTVLEKEKLKPVLEDAFLYEGKDEKSLEKALKTLAEEVHSRRLWPTVLSSYEIERVDVPVVPIPPSKKASSDVLVQLQNKYFSVLHSKGHIAKTAEEIVLKAISSEEELRKHNEFLGRLVLDLKEIDATLPEGLLIYKRDTSDVYVVSGDLAKILDIDTSKDIC